MQDFEALAAAGGGFGLGAQFDGQTLGGSVAQSVADLIEAEYVRQKDEPHCCQMVPHRVFAGLGIHPILPSGGLDNPLRNILEKLPQHIDVMA